MLQYGKLRKMLHYGKLHELLHYGKFQEQTINDRRKNIVTFSHAYFNRHNLSFLTQSLVSDLSETRRHVSHRFTACVITKISKHVHL